MNLTWSALNSRRSRRRLRMVGLALVLSGAGCAPGTDAVADATNASFASYDAGAVPGGPGAKQPYRLGAPPSDSLLRAMNQDVNRDGDELPAGRGTVAEGAIVYAAQCASCHGAAGEGVPTFPKLVGRDSSTRDFPFATTSATKTIGNYWPYATTLFDYIKRAMPLATPGSLSDAQVYAVTAFLLSANDIIADSATLDAAALRAVRMPARDRFVPDDRKPNAAPMK